jgi:hypothetical protein
MSKGLRGSNNPNWRGGKTITQHGYVLIRVGCEHHLADVRGYAYEHRLVAEEKLERHLEEGEVIHHRNGNKTDNRPENIEVLPSIGHHLQVHAQNKDTRRVGEGNPTISCACGCGNKFLKYDRWGRPRTFVSGHNLYPKDGGT